jgi:hypothetical protein
MTITNRIPPSQPTDAGEVAEALGIATSLWRKGNYSDAIRWVRRAAEAADHAGDTSRMSALARASADLEESMTAAPRILSSVPPPLPVRPASTLPPPPASSSRVKPRTTPPPLPRTTPASLPPQAARPVPPATDPQENRSRLRVSVKTSVRDPALLVVRHLGEGKALPPGTREGWLVMSEPATVDAAPSNGKSSR